MNERKNISTPKISKNTSERCFLVHGHTKKIRGFLMTEAILSLFVLSTGLTTVLALITSSLKDSFESRDTIIAVELAQEGVELVRNVRDNGFLNGTGDPKDPFYKFSNSKRHCHIDYTNSSDANLDCSANFNASSYALGYDTASGFYKYTGGAGGKFSRYVYIDYNNGAGQATVRSFVYWGATPNFVGGTGNTAGCTIAKKCVFTEIVLTNWKG